MPAINKLPFEVQFLTNSCGHLYGQEGPATSQHTFMSSSIAWSPNSWYVTTNNCLSIFLYQLPRKVSERKKSKQQKTVSFRWCAVVPLLKP